MGSVDPNIVSGINPSVSDVPALNNITTYFSWFCYVIAVIMIMIQGIQFLQAAPEGKAKIKENLSKIAIGSFFLVSIGSIVDIVKNLTSAVSDKTPYTVARSILGSAQVVCYVYAVILIMWMGVKWLSVSPEGKAEMKKSLIAAAIGSGLLVGAGTILMTVGKMIQ